MSVKEIKALEKLSRKLEPTQNERKKLRKEVHSYSDNFLNRIEKNKAYEIDFSSSEKILSSPISEEPLDIKKALRILNESVDTPGLNPASGGHLGYIPGGGIYLSSLGDYLADVTNRYAGVYFAGPGAVKMENMLIRWMARMVGYPADCGGNLASGGSISNLAAIVAARDSRNIKGKDLEKNVIYLTSQAHHCIDKAIRIGGMAECPRRHIKMDHRFRMDVDDLKNQIAEDKKNGLTPFLIIASAGTTDVGAVDPLEEIGKIANQEKAWFHVDGAYGAFFLLTKKGKELMKGIELSDSVVMDPHKGLFLPYGLGVVLVKNMKDLNKAHSYQANYMQDTLSAIEEVSPADVSPELTKHFRGLRLWLPLKLHGTKPFIACLEEKLLLADYFHKEVSKLGFETGPGPELSVVTYRYVPKKGNADAFNEALVKEVQKDGRVFISSTKINGNYTLRLAVLSFRTHLSTINLTLKILKEKVKLLEKGLATK